MSFYRVLKPTKEAMANMPKKHVFDYKDVRESLMANCMETTDMIKARKEIDFSLSFIYSAICSEAIEDAHNQFEKDGEIVYCGWQYSNNSENLDKEELKETVKKDLSILKSLVPTPDYFENKEKFFEKINDINSEIDYFVDSAYECARFEIIEKLKDFDVTYKEDEIENTEV